LDDLTALLRLQIEWGADEALDADPLDRLRADAMPPPARTTPQAVATAPRPLTVAPPPASSRTAAAERAAAAAAAATSVEGLREAIAAFDGCALRDTASHLVWAEGDTSTGVLIVGEAPGRDEDRGGHPFAGADGALLDQMLGSIGLSRAGVMITPLLPWRPPGGRPPNAGELAVCLPFLQRLIVLAAPRWLLIFGNTGARSLLPAAAARRRVVPTWVDADIPGLHRSLPSLVLPAFTEMHKTPALHRVAWGGLRLLRRALDIT
jgi:uracil-DNA glycosylase